MKKIGQIREQYDLITEKEEAESRKLTTLVRAGLFDPKKLPMLKRALSKDAKDMTPAERKILIELLDSLMAEVLQSSQVYSKVKQNVSMKEEKDFEYEMARSELKALIADAQKILSNLKGEGNLEAWVQSKITKAADYINAAADNIEHSDSDISEAVKTADGYYSKVDPRYQKMPTDREIPTIIILKRKAIRIYPDNQKVALYYSQALDKYVTIPFGTLEGGAVNEAVNQKKGATDDEKRQALRNRIAAAQAIRNQQVAAEKEPSKSKEIEVPKSEPFKSKKKEPATPDKKDDGSKLEKTRKSFYDKEIKSKMDLGRAKVLMKRDPDINLATRAGTMTGLAARQAWDNSAMKKALNKVKSSYKIGKNQAKKIDTAFEETDTKSKFYAKRNQQKLDEYSKAELAWDAATMIPGIGNALSGAEAVYKLAKGDYVGAAAAGIGAIPGVGQAGKGAKIATKLATTGAKEVGKEVGEKAVKEVGKEAGEKLFKKPTAPEIKPSSPTPTRPQEPIKAPEPAPVKTPEPPVKAPEPKPAEIPTKPGTKVEPKTQTKTEPKAETKVEPKTEPVASPKTGSRTGSRTGRVLRRLGKGVGAAALGALAGAAGASVEKDIRPTKEFGMKVSLKRPEGNVRTAVQARDNSIYRKAMQQNESVLKQLYSINENEDKTIQIASENVVINSNMAKKIISVYESVNKSNKQKLETMLNESVDSFKKILSFAARQ